ncbi:MAG: glycyl-radical enzyme activating protein [bacterium]
MTNTKAFIFNIQRFCLHDGPGIRTTIFLKGCLLRCLWCCNPESFNPDIEATTSGIMAGKRSVKEVYKAIASDVVFFRNSDGGVTFSGGEPLLQIDFLEKIMEKCHQENINIAVETCGYAPWENFEKILKYVDYILYDIKQIDSRKHKAMTGVPNEIILENVKKISKQNTNLIIRIPLIPGYTDDEKNINGIGEFIKPLSVKEVNLLPYHRLGKDKYKLAKDIYKLANLKDMATTEEGRKSIKKCKAILESYNLKVFVGG